MLFSPRNPLNIPSAWLSRALFPIWDLRDHSDRLVELGRLQRSQWLKPEILQDMQYLKLNQLLAEISRTVPFYDFIREPILSEVGLRERIPVLTKAMVREHADALITTDPLLRGALLSAKTGGSTGTSLFVKFDHDTQQHRNAAAMRSDMWAGWRMGHWTGALWGSPERPQGLKAQLRNLTRDRFTFLDTMRLDAHSMGEFLRLMQQRRIDALFGHAHSLYILANFALTRGYRVPAPKAIVSTSMMLLAPERAVIEQAFGCKVTDRYGCEEVGLIAGECEQHAGYHITAEHLIVEILDSSGVPCAPGEIGRVVVTDLQNRGMPLLRYEIGDLAAWATTPCPCGRGLPTLERVVGRQADCLQRRDGSLAAGVSLVERTLLAIPGIAQLQLVQETPEKLIAYVVKGTGASEQTATALIGALTADLGEGLQFEVREVARIPQEKNGKYRFAIRRF